MSRSKVMGKDGGEFRFRRHDTIGAADAEEDVAFLRECFVETEDFAILRDCDDPRRIVVGSPGSGKTALLSQLRESEERVIEVRPESLALAHVSNSTILRFFAALGVNLDIFFRLLWRHVFAIELLREHFNIRTEEDAVGTLRKLYAVFKTDEYRAAIKYLETWGKSFWLETERRVKEVTTTLEEELRGVVKTGFPALSLSVSGAEKLTEAEKEEIVDRAQSVINKIQIRQLSELIELVGAVLSDRQKLYYVVIDKLDVDWVEDRLRYRLIRALIETVRDFRKVKRAKIIVALRVDLLDRVFRLTRDAGFQEEKYESLYLRIDWAPERLTEMLDRRIGALVKCRYTSRVLSHTHSCVG